MEKMHIFLNNMNEFLIDKEIVQISAGYHHTVGIDKNGKVWTWGQNGGRTTRK